MVAYLRLLGGIAAFSQLGGCATWSQPALTFQDLHEGTDAHQVLSRKTSQGWIVTSTLLHPGDKDGTVCGGPAAVQIHANLVGNVYTVRGDCEARPAPSEERWRRVIAREFSAMIDASPIVSHQFAQLGKTEFDWYFVAPDVRFALARVNEESQAAPRLVISAAIPPQDADVEEQQQEGLSTILTAVHEYFHINAKRQAWKFESIALNETMAYLISHSAAIDLGAGHAPTWIPFLKPPLDGVWIDVLRDGRSLARSIAGLRLAHVILLRTQACPSPGAAMRGIANLAYFGSSGNRVGDLGSF